MVQAYTVTNDLVATGDLPAQAHCLLIRHPHLGQEPARVQAGEYRRVDDVGLDPRLGDKGHLPRVGNDHASNERRDRLHDRRRVPSRFYDDMILLRQLTGERRQMLA